jgi:uncharacterized phage infection (PIP) family protein YhgE
MAAITFDALIFSHKLTDAGMPREQADKFAEIQKEAFDEQQQDLKEQNQHFEEKLDKTISAHLATKEDLWNLKQDLKQDISNLNAELKKDISTVKQDTANLDKKVDLLRKEFEGKFNLLYWMLGFILAFCASNAAVVFKLYVNS